MPDPIDRHRAVPYQVQDLAAPQTTFDVTPLADRRGFQVTGLCPGCGGRTTTTWIFGSGNGYKGLPNLIPRRNRQPPEGTPRPGPRTLCCDCGHAHADRPDDALFRGCGSYWQVEFRP